jgi:hypothetical protein
LPASNQSSPHNFNPTLQIQPTLRANKMSSEFEKTRQLARGQMAFLNAVLEGLETGAMEPDAGLALPVPLGNLLATLATDKAAAQADVANQKAAAEADFARHRAAAEADLARQKAAAEAGFARQKAAAEADFARRKAAAEEQLAAKEAEFQGRVQAFETQQTLLQQLLASMSALHDKVGQGNASSSRAAALLEEDGIVGRAVAAAAEKSTEAAADIAKSQADAANAAGKSEQAVAELAGNVESLRLSQHECLGHIGSGVEKLQQDVSHTLEAQGQGIRHIKKFLGEDGALAGKLLEKASGLDTLLAQSFQAVEENVRQRQTVLAQEVSGLQASVSGQVADTAKALANDISGLQTSVSGAIQQGVAALQESVSGDIGSCSHALLLAVGESKTDVRDTIRASSDTVGAQLSEMGETIKNGVAGATATVSGAIGQAANQMVDKGWQRRKRCLGCHWRGS